MNIIHIFKNFKVCTKSCNIHESYLYELDTRDTQELFNESVITNLFNIIIIFSIVCLSGPLVDYYVMLNIEYL